MGGGLSRWCSRDRWYSGSLIPLVATSTHRGSTLFHLVMENCGLGHGADRVAICVLGDPWRLDAIPTVAGGNGARDRNAPATMVKSPPPPCGIGNPADANGIALAGDRGRGHIGPFWQSRPFAPSDHGFNGCWPHADIRLVGHSN